jgi:hypothetical protein
MAVPIDPLRLLPEDTPPVDPDETVLADDQLQTEEHIPQINASTSANEGTSICSSCICLCACVCDCTEVYSVCLCLCLSLYRVCVSDCTACVCNCNVVY